MKIWLYCSYPSSSIGFQLGYVDDGDPSGTIVKGEPHELLDRCFSYQGIMGAYGRIPGTGSYVYFRPIKRQRGDSLFLNIGFESESKAEYEHIYSFFEQFSTNVHTDENRRRREEKLRSEEEDRLFSKIKPIIIEDPGDLAFGLRVDQPYLASVVKEIKSCPYSVEHDDNFYLQSAFETEGESFASNLCLSSVLGEGYGLKLVKLEEKGDNQFVIVAQDSETEAQKKTGLTRMLPVLLIIAAIAVLILTLSGTDKPKDSEMEAQVNEELPPKNSLTQSDEYYEEV